MHIKPFKALTPELDLIKSVDTFFSTVKMEFPKYNEAGFFKTEAKEAFYIYKISEGNHSYTGILNSSSVEDYKNGLIKKHEKTISVKDNNDSREIRQIPIKKQTNIIFKVSFLIEKLYLFFKIGITYKAYNIN